MSAAAPKKNETSKRRSSEALHGYVHKFRLESHDGAHLEVAPHAVSDAVHGGWLFSKFVVAALVLSGLLAVAAGTIGN